MRVLIVEDDAALALFLKKGLEIEGHETVCASDGEAAIAAAFATSPELVVLDLNLPRRDGADVLRTLRAAGSSAAVLVLTGRLAVEERVACLDAGADDYLQKPFSFHEMLARCRALGRRHAGAVSQTVQHGTLRVDRVSRSVMLGERAVELTGKEYTLLDYLLQHRGRAVSRAELLEKVWKMSPDAGTNVVDVYVNYLRRKLHQPGTSDLVETVRGSGYTMSLANRHVPEPVGKKPVASCLPLPPPLHLFAGAA